MSWGNPARRPSVPARPLPALAKADLAKALDLNISKCDSNYLVTSPYLLLSRSHLEKYEARRRQTMGSAGPRKQAGVSYGITKKRNYLIISLEAARETRCICQVFSQQVL